MSMDAVCARVHKVEKAAVPIFKIVMFPLVLSWFIMVGLPIPLVVAIVWGVAKGTWEISKLLWKAIKNRRASKANSDAGREKHGTN